MEAVRIPLTALGFVPSQSLTQSVTLLLHSMFCPPLSVSCSASTHLEEQLCPILSQLHACDALSPFHSSLDCSSLHVRHLPLCTQCLAALILNIQILLGSGEDGWHCPTWLVATFSKAFHKLSQQLCKDSNLLCCHAVLTDLTDRSTRKFQYLFAQFIFQNRKQFIYSNIVSSLKNVAIHVTPPITHIARPLSSLCSIGVI